MKMIKSLLLLWSLIITVYLNAQKSPSLATNKALSLKSEVDSLLKTFPGKRANEPTVALDIATRSLQISNELNYKEGIGNSFRAFGNLYYDKGEYFKAIEEFLKAEEVFKEIKNHERLAVIKNDIGLQYIYLGDSEVAKKNLRESLVIATEIEDTISMANAYSNLAKALSHEGNIEESISMLKEVLTLDSLQNEWIYYAFGLASISQMYKSLREYDTAIDFSLRALSIGEEFGQNKISYSATAAIGDIYKHLEDYESSKLYLEKSLQFAKNANNNQIISEAYGRLQLLNTERGSFDIALKYADSSLRFASPRMKPLILNNIGFTYNSKLMEYDKGYEYFKMAIDSANRLKQPTLKIDPLLNTAIVFRNKKESKKSLRYAVEGIELADSLDIELKDFRILKEIATILREAGKFDMGYNILDKVSIIQDSLLSIERATQKKLRLKENEISELKIREQDLTIETERQKLRYGTAIISLLAILILTILITYINTRKKNKQLDLGREEVEKLNGAMHHGLHNNIQWIISLIANKKRKITDVQTKELVESISARIAAMGRIYKSVFDVNNKLNTNVTFYLKNLIHRIIEVSEYEELNLETIIEICEVGENIEFREATMIGQVVTEVITNAFKHGLVKIPNPKLEILTQLKNNRLLEIKISDNGILTPNFRTRSLVDILVQNMLLNEEASPQIFC